MTKIHETARVCVSAVQEAGWPSANNTETRDGAAMPPRGRARCARHLPHTTTTYYTLRLFISSSGRENNVSVHNSRVVA